MDVVVVNETATAATPGKHNPSFSPLAVNDVETAENQDNVQTGLEEIHRNPMGHSTLDNIEINMVYILFAEFQPTTSQPSFLDGDVVLNRPHKSTS